MELIGWLCISIPLLAVCYGLLVWLYPRVKKQYSVIPKCVGSLVCVASAWYAVTASGEAPWCQPVVWALLFCMLGDLLIEWNLIAGGLSFAAAHTVLIFWIFSQGFMHFGSIFVWLVSITAVCSVLRIEFHSMGLMAPLLILFAMILTGDFALAAVLPFLQGVAYLPLAAGLFCFVASDTILGKDMFGSSVKKNHWSLMALYYAALYLISLALWILP